MHLRSARWLALLLAIALAAGASAWQLSAPAHDAAIHVIWVASPAPAPPARAAYITGAVVRPGLYPLPAGARLADLVSASGGFSAAADTRAINLARYVADGEHVEIPVLAAEREPGMLRLNHAGRVELLALPGMTSQGAVALLDSIKRLGPIRSAGELRERAILPDELVDQIAPLLDWSP